MLINERWKTCEDYIGGGTKITKKNSIKKTAEH